MIFVVFGGIVMEDVLQTSNPMEPGVPWVGMEANGNSFLILTVRVRGAICDDVTYLAMLGDVVMK